MPEINDPLHRIIFPSYVQFWTCVNIFVISSEAQRKLNNSITCFPPGRWLTKTDRKRPGATLLQALFIPRLELFFTNFRELEI